MNKNEPNWNGLYVCIDCGKGISKLTADSYIGRCVACFKEFDNDVCYK